jgi:hypothetical protein
MDLRAASQTFTGMLRQHQRIRTCADANTVHAAHAPMDATLHKLVRAAPPQEALMLSSARSARPSKQEHGLTFARGPPAIAGLRNSLPVQLDRALARTHHQARIREVY